MINPAFAAFAMAAVIPGATHQYPNGTNHPLVMAGELWAFFRQHSLP